MHNYLNVFDICYAKSKRNFKHYVRTYFQKSNVMITQFQIFVFVDKEIEYKQNVDEF